MTWGRAALANATESLWITCRGKPFATDDSFAAYLPRKKAGAQQVKGDLNCSEQEEAVAGVPDKIASKTKLLEVSSACVAWTDMRSDNTFVPNRLAPHGVCSNAP